MLVLCLGCYVKVKVCSGSGLWTLQKVSVSVKFIIKACVTVMVFSQRHILVLDVPIVSDTLRLRFQCACVLVFMLLC